MDHRGQYQYGGKLNLKNLILVEEFWEGKKNGLGKL